MPTPIASGAALHPGLYRLFYIPMSTGNVLDRYKSIAWQLGLPIERNRAAAYRAIHTEVSRLVLETKIHPLLIVDEAQHLRNDVLEDLRLLTNYAMDAERRLCLLLVGLPELRRRLSMAVHESLAQRIVVRYHLSGLSRELPAYLTRRLQLAGCMQTPVRHPALRPAALKRQGGRPTARGVAPDRRGHRLSLRRAGPALSPAPARGRLLPAAHSRFQPERFAVLIRYARPDANRLAPPSLAWLHPPTLLDAVTLAERSLGRCHQTI
jgi:AAA domain